MTMHPRHFRLATSLLLALSAIITARADAAPRMVRVAILCGQSNMAGGSPPTALGAWPQVWLDMSSVTDQPNTSWKGLKLPIENGEGLQAGVGEILQGAFPDDQIAILKVSQGATGVTYWSNPGSAGYEALMDRITIVRDRLEAQKTSGEIAGYEFVGFFYMQGENETNGTNTDTTKRYFEYFHKLITAVRARTATPQLKVIVGRTSIAYSPSTIREAYGDYRVDPPPEGQRDYADDSEFINSPVMRGQALYEGYPDTVRTAQAGFTLQDTNSAWAEADDFPLGDYWHFSEGETGKITLGRRMARAMLRLRGLPAEDELKVTVGPHRWVHPGTITLTGTVVSGPANPSTIQWTQVPLAGQPTATIASTNTLSTDVTLPSAGTYAFRLSVSEGSHRHGQTVNVYVLPAGENLPAYGTAPIFYAPRPGAPVTLEAQIVNPDSDPLTYTWNAPFSQPHRRFGQGKAILTSTTNATATARFTWPGVQILRLQFSDGTSRSDGNASGWINVPVLVGTDSPTFPDYSARWSFDESDYLLAELNDTGPVETNNNVTQAPDTPVGGGSGVFDGATSYLQNHIGSSWNFDPLFSKVYTNCTIAMWVKPDAPASGTQVLYEEGGSSERSAITLRMAGGQLQAGIFEAGTLHTATALAPEAGKWTHVAMTFDSAAREIKLWGNGQVIATATNLPFSQISARRWPSAIGARLQQDAWNTATNTADFYSGKMDDVRLYERALASPDISGLYADGVDAAAAGAVSFAYTSRLASVAESGGTVQLTVQRALGTTGSASVNYATADGSATAGTDYTQTSGTVSWADGESDAKTITIPVLNDGIVTGNRSFSLALSGASGATLTDPSTATVTILEDDANTAPVVAITRPSGGSALANRNNNLVLAATASDDGKPDGSTVSVAWSQVSGPAGQTASFGSSTAASTPVTFPADGNYVLRFTASDGAAASSADVNVLVGNGTYIAPGSGVTREFYSGISNTAVTNLTTSTKFINEQPDSVTTLTNFETPSNVGDNYGQRVRGYFVAPQTGNYKFVIASDDKSELWLGTDTSTNNKVKIAAVTTYTGSRVYDKETNQTSTNIPLTAGGAYYIEALMKEGTGNDHLSVGVTLPDNTTNRPIPGTFLSAYGQTATNVSPNVANASIESQTGLTANLLGTVLDDGKPSGSSVEIAWSLVSGPGSADFASPDSASTAVTLSAPGDYVLRLSATDGASTVFRDLSLTATGTAFGTWIGEQPDIGAQTGMHDDPDGDGLSNLAEFALGGDPTAPQSGKRPSVGQTEVASDKFLTLTFHRGRPDITYIVEASSDLNAPSGGWTEIARNPGSVGADQTVADTSPMSAQNPKRFLRLRVEIP